MLTTAKKHRLILLLLLVLGFGLRIYRLGALSFSEDESHKIEAVQSYLHGDITPNAEHPMLMKNLILLSYVTEQWWNKHIGASRGRLWTISEEAAVRFPNALFGALTIFPLYWLAESFLGGEIALLAAALWATGLNAISFNRLAKEDTLLVFFMLFAFFFFRKAKLFGDQNPERRDQAALLSGAMFGLMLASKYFPGFLGINFIFYYAFRRHRPENRGIPPKILAQTFVVMGIVFVAANPSILIPSVWHYLIQYTREGLLAHHGYLFMGKLYFNLPQRTIFGTPFYFYALYFLVKTPLPVLTLFLAGFVNLFRPRDHYGKQFLLYILFFWFVSYSLIGAKWLRYSLHFLAFFYMIAATGFYDLWTLAKRGGARLRQAGTAGLRLAFAPAGALLTMFLVFNTFTNLPYPLLYVNSLGGGRAYAATYFPQDEYYDAGFSQAYEFVARQAPENSTVATDAQGVFRHYANRLGRADLRLTLLSGKDLNPAGSGPVFVLLHEGNHYFENELLFQNLPSRETPVHIVRIRDREVVRVYRLNPVQYAEMKKVASSVAVAEAMKENVERNP